MPARRITPSDVVVVGLILLVATTLMLVFRRDTVERARAMQCMSNLSRIGVVLLLYSNDERNGSYPLARYDPQTADRPAVGTPYSRDLSLTADPTADPFKPGPLAPAANDVTASIYLLLRKQDIKPRTFVCPGTAQTPLGGDDSTFDPRVYTNWPGKQALRDHLSYSVHMSYKAAGQWESGVGRGSGINSEFAMAADLNPGGVALLISPSMLAPAPPTPRWASDVAYKFIEPTSRPAPARNSSRANARRLFSLLKGRPRPENSRNHGGVGQNVLFQDGHVEFVTNPFVGVARDNIYTTGGWYGSSSPLIVQRLVGAPSSNDDSVLLPSAEQLVD